MNKHKLPFKTALRLGLSIKKPIRFVFTVLLTTFAFAMTGLALIAGFYDEERSKVQTYAQFTDEFVLYPSENDGELTLGDLRSAAEETELPYAALASTSLNATSGTEEKVNMQKYAQEHFVHVASQVNTFAYASDGFFSVRKIELLAGKEVLSAGEAVVPSCLANFLLAYGAGNSYESLVGKKVSFSFYRGERSVNFTVAGVYDNPLCNFSQRYAEGAFGDFSTEPCYSTVGQFAGALFVSGEDFSAYANSVEYALFAGDHTVAAGERVRDFFAENSEKYVTNLYRSIEMHRHEIVGMTNALGIAGGVLTGFSVLMLFQFILLSIDGKRQMIGILRALGGRGADIVTIFLIESGFLGLLSGIFAVSLSAGLVPVINLVFSSLFGAQNIAIMTYRPLAFVLVAAMSLLVSLLSALFPVLREARRLPVDVIKFNVE